MSMAFVQIPENSVALDDGRVVEIKVWCCRKGEYVLTQHIKREVDESIACYIDDLEYGGRTFTATTIEQALRGRIHPTVRGPLIEAFTRTGLTKADVRKLFPRYKIVVG